jgi:hypothetical protein
LTFAFGQEHHGFVARPRVFAGSALGAVAIAAIGSAPAAPRALHGQLLISEWSYEGSCGTEYGRDELVGVDPIVPRRQFRVVDPVARPVVAPGGSALAFLRPGGRVVIAGDAGLPWRPRLGGRVEGVRWSPGGSRLGAVVRLARGHFAIVVADPAVRRVAILRLPRGAQEVPTKLRVADGGQVAVRQLARSDSADGLFAGGPDRPLTRVAPSWVVAMVALSQDGSTLAYQASDDDSRARAPVVRLVRFVGPRLTRSLRPPSTRTRTRLGMVLDGLTADGRVVIFQGPPAAPSGLAFVADSGTVLRRIPGADGLLGRPPDARRLVFTRFSHLVIADPDGGHLRRLPFRATLRSAPVWSPDARAFAFLNGDQATTIDLARGTRRTAFNPTDDGEFALIGWLRHPMRPAVRKLARTAC